MAKTSEEVLVELTAALEEARVLLRDIRGASKDLKQLLKVERSKQEEIVRDETRNLILKIGADIQRVTEENVDEILAQLRTRLLGE